MTYSERYKAMIEWLTENYTALNGYIYFNAVTTEEGNVSLNPVASTRSLRHYVNSSRRAEFKFSISLTLQYDSGTSDINVDAAEEVDRFMNWFEAENNAGHYPNFGDDVTILYMRVQDNTVTPRAVNGEENLAEYPFTCAVGYVKR